MKRGSWLDSIADAAGGSRAMSAEDRVELSDIDQRLFDAWNLGENIVLAWTQASGTRRFLAIRHYRILEPFAADSAAAGSEAGAFINRVLAGPKRVTPEAFGRLGDALGAMARLIVAPVRPGSGLPDAMISSLVTRYGVSLVRERAVMLLDAVGFSLHTPLEQVAMLNSISYSVNSAYRQLVSDDVLINFARSSTGDGFYIWNRARTLEANVALYKLMMLILADNAVAQSKARNFPVPHLRAAFHVGEHYEFYQVEALNPTTFSYIVGQVTIELSRIVEKALPGQILLGDFSIGMRDGDGIVPYGTLDFIGRTSELLSQLEGLSVANDHIERIRCYVTGEEAPGGGFVPARYVIRDKHGMTRPVFNAKINMHLRRGKPIYLGFQHKDLHPPGDTGPKWIEHD